MTTSKTPAKKPTAKKVDTVKVVENTEIDEQQVGVKFEAFRQRAFRDQGKKAGVTANDEPFILSTEDGFDEDIILERPSLPARLSIEAAFERGSAISTLQLVFGDHFSSVVSQLADYEEETGMAPEAVLSGIVSMYIEHFFGKAAREVFTKLST